MVSAQVLRDAHCLALAAERRGRLDPVVQRGRSYSAGYVEVSVVDHTAIVGTVNHYKLVRVACELRFVLQRVIDGIEARRAMPPASKDADQCPGLGTSMAMWIN